MAVTDRFAWRPTAILIVAAAIIVAVFAMTFGAASRQSALGQAREQASRRAALEAGALVADVDKFRTLPFVLVELPDVAGALDAGDGAATTRLNETLAQLARQTGATVFYAVDRAGRSRAASNAGQSDSFVGYDFRFRPYFVNAMRAGRSEYFAKGSVTGRPGLFLSRRADAGGRPIGVVVVKIEFDRIERLWRSAAQSVMVVNGDGIIVIATDPARRLQTVAPLTPARRADLARSGQFGDEPLRDAGLRFADGFATDAAGRRFIAIEQQLPVLGWRHVHLERTQPILAAADARTRLATLTLALVLAGLIALIRWSAGRRRNAELARLALEAEVTRRTAELTQSNLQLRRESEERILADRRYRAAREELAQANRLGSIGTITTSVAHEVNQPLAAIRTASENGLKLLQRGRTEEAAANLSLIVGLTQRIGSITGELLSYARRGRGQRKPVPVDQILDGALMLVSESFRRAGVTLEVAREPDLPIIRVARIRIEQVLVNLLQNALEAVAGGSEPMVRLSAAADGQAVRFIVSDNGPGIAEALSEAIFQPFYTGKPAGTGLGLGISREIVLDHRGTLSVYSSDLGGAEFTVTLPLGAEPE